MLLADSENCKVRPPFSSNFLETCLFLSLGAVGRIGNPRVFWHHTHIFPRHSLQTEQKECPCYSLGAASKIGLFRKSPAIFCINFPERTHHEVVAWLSILKHDVVLNVFSFFGVSAIIGLFFTIF